MAGTKRKFDRPSTLTKLIVISSHRRQLLGENHHRLYPTGTSRGRQLRRPRESSKARSAAAPGSAPCSPAAIET